MADDMPSVPAPQRDKVALWTEVKRRRANGDLLGAMPILDRLCAGFPDDPRFFLFGAEALIEAGRPDEAAARLKRAIQLSPQDERPQTLLAGLPAAGADGAAAALLRRLQALAAEGRQTELIRAYHAALRKNAATV